MVRWIRMRCSTVCRWVFGALMAVLAVEVVVVNLFILHVYFSIRQEMAGLSSSSPLLDNLLSIPSVKQLVYDAKQGGFQNMLQHSFGRVFMVTENADLTPSDKSWMPEFERTSFSYLSVDVSDRGEVLYLLRRMKARGTQMTHNYKPLVIDIGANDGLLASNSFNLIQLGWNAILVEPQMSLIQQAKQNIDRYSDPYNRGKQHVVLVNAVLGDHDGSVDFVLSQVSDMESHIFNPDKDEAAEGSEQLQVTVPSMTVKTFAAKYRVPLNFGLLSVDAEGQGDTILHQWLDEGYRPAYIIFEGMHNKEPMGDTHQYLKLSGYHFLSHLGWNYIYEHVASPHDASHQGAGSR